MECGPWGSGEGPGGDHVGWADQETVSRGHRQGLGDGQVLGPGAGLCRWGRRHEECQVRSRVRPPKEDVDELTRQ